MTKYLNENLEVVKKYFKDRKWAVGDFKQAFWTRHS